MTFSDWFNQQQSANNFHVDDTPLLFLAIKYAAHTANFKTGDFETYFKQDVLIPHNATAIDISDLTSGDGNRASYGLYLTESGDMVGELELESEDAFALYTSDDDIQSQLGISTDKITVELGVYADVDCTPLSEMIQQFNLLYDMFQHHKFLNTPMSDIESALHGLPNITNIVLDTYTSDIPAVYAENANNQIVEIQQTTAGTFNMITSTQSINYPTLIDALDGANTFLS